MTTVDIRTGAQHPLCPGCAARHRIEDTASIPEVLRLRCPTGDRELWVRYGPAGPPEREEVAR